MTAHRAIIEAGPGRVRRLCCGAGRPASPDPDLAAVALDAADDQVALVDERPVAVATLWHTMLTRLTCDPGRGAVVVHPSWWAPSRVAQLTSGLTAGIATAAHTARPRSRLLAGSASPSGALVVVEIAPDLVAVTATTMAAEPRRGDPRCVAAAVVRRVVDLAAAGATVLIDAPSTVAGAADLAAVTAARIRDAGFAVEVIDDARLAECAAAATARDTAAVPCSAPARAGPAARPRLLAGAAAVGVVLALAASGMWHGDEPDRGEPPPAAFLVEGRIALQVPADWPVQRISSGPGSARVQVTSPSDPQVALHVTQAPAVAADLGAVADALRRAIDAEPAGVFVDFNPAGVSAGRPAVTYREVRVGHHTRWTVLVDGAVRIGIGCQSRPDGADAVRPVCERAVRSVHTLG